MNEKEKLIKGIVQIQVIKYFKDNWGIVIVKPTKIEENYNPPVLDSFGEFVIKGNMPILEMGEQYHLVAKEIIDPNWGTQYQVIFINQEVDIDDTYKQKVFLRHILTEKQYTDLYEALPNPFDVIKAEDVETLVKIKGIGLTTATKLIQKYKQTIDFSDVYIELDALGLTDVMIKKLCSSYGSPQILIQKFRENPYILCEDVDGIGFKRADEFALKYGIDPKSSLRIKAFIDYYLNDEANKGNSWVETTKLLSAIDEFLGVIDRKVIGNVLLGMKYLWWSDDKKRVALQSIYNLETAITHELMRLLNADNEFEYDHWEDVIKNLEINNGFEYTDEQKQGVKITLDNNVAIVTGLAGSGKTTISKAMLKTLESYPFAQTALAGKAAQRMTEVTGYEGYTIHRLLGFSFKNDPPPWRYHEKNKLPYDIIILDECSMVGGELFLSLLKAIRTGAKLIILGDYGQLESIGKCNVFHDMINSGVIPVAKLTKIHRQAQKSAVITESHKVRRNEQIIDRDFVGKKVLGELQDLELDIYHNNDGNETPIHIIKQFQEKFPLVDNNILDIQIIVPQKERGYACTFRLNNAIQQLVNKDGENEVEIKLSKDKTYKLREGDKVLNVSNNYNTLSLYGEKVPIFNGNVGIIKKINIQDELMVIDFIGVGNIVVEKGDWSSIQLGYAVTCHKYQGSSAKLIIIGLDYSAYMLLTCEWLYTALTRTEQHCVLVGENKAIRYATSQSRVSTKQTFLKELLKASS